MKLESIVAVMKYSNVQCCQSRDSSQQVVTVS